VPPCRKERGSSVEYCEICLTIPAEALEAVAHLLHTAGTGGVVIDDETRAELRAYLPRDERLPQRLGALRQELMDLVAFFPGMSELRQTERFVAEEDWANAWREHFHPIRIGRRLVVAPTWEPFAPRVGELVLRLDPGMAFGTGTHPSTVLCLRALEDLVADDLTVLDVGTGSGILAVAAAMLGASVVTALDIDPLAVRVARQNVATNGVAQQVHVHYAELRDLLTARTPPCDICTANLTADALVELAPDLAAALAPGGTLVASGIVGEGSSRVQSALRQAGLRILQAVRLEDWVAVWARRA